uniref:Ig-like domain-containing protein n=1 Tax=Podarcis muralis TaxID=64176 RepID=A0A670HQS2_PODMU
MAAGLPQSRCSNPGVKVTQQPPVVSKRQGETLELSCGVNQVNWFFYWYRQQPGEPKLQYFGTFSTYIGKRSRPPSGWGESGEGALTSTATPPATPFSLFPIRTRLIRSLLRVGRRQRTQMGSNRGGNQIGFSPTQGTKSNPPPALVTLLLPPFSILLKKTTQIASEGGFPYEWPIDVSWKRDAQEVTRLSFATDPVRTLNGTCNFGVSSRLSMTAAEWQERHVYSCHVRQGNIAEAEEPTLAPSRFPSTIQSVGADL